MSSTGTLIPIRIPELGPSLGKLTGERVRADDPIQRDATRLQLVTRLFTNAGDGRRLAVANDRVPAVASLSADSWLSLWEEAILKLSGAIAEFAETRIQEEARRVRMPARLRKRLEINDEDRRAITARLGYCGSQLVHVLDDVERAGRVVLAAPATQQRDLEKWQESQLRAARRLGFAWTQLEEVLDRELESWDAAVESVGKWRKSSVPVIVFLAVGLLVGVWVGLVLGGYIESPAWFTSLWNMVFSADRMEVTAP